MAHYRDVNIELATLGRRKLSVDQELFEMGSV